VTVPPIVRVLQAARSRRPDPLWLAAESRVANERTAVEALLETDARVYGFSTHLGHLDRFEKDPDADHENALLNAHLIGPTSALDPDTARLALACKVEQLTNGGSGIHPATFRSLVESIETLSDTPIRGCWLSYGAGDVVPAAWLVNALIRSERLRLDHPGDVIATINGHFFSTAQALETSLRFAELIGSVLSVMARHGSPAPSSTGWEADALVTWQALQPHPMNRGHVQLPLSLRDTEPMARALLNSLVHLRTTLAARLSAQSANPLFVATETGVAAVSQNSFLDFGLTFALTEATQSALLALGYVQRITHHTVHLLQSEAREPRQELVQVPKLVAALIAEAESTLTLATDFVGDESEGVEDVRDLSLIQARALSTTLVGFCEPGLELLSALSVEHDTLAGRKLAVELLLGDAS